VSRTTRVSASAADASVVSMPRASMIRLERALAPPARVISALVEELRVSASSLSAYVEQMESGSALWWQRRRTLPERRRLSVSASLLTVAQPHLTVGAGG